MKFAIEKIKKQNFENIIINPIQVIPSAILNENSISISKSLFRKGNWTAIEIKSKEIGFLYRDEKYNEGKLSFSFTGRINGQISNIQKFLKLPNSLNSNDLGYLASYLFKKFKYKFQHEIWYDLTHDALQTETKLKNISYRNFHSFDYCKEKNTITKKHINKDSSSDTIAYYKKLEKKDYLKRFFPTILEVISNKNISSYTLEYIPFPTLSELFLHESLDHHIWERIIQKLKYIYDEIYPNALGIYGLSSSDFFSGKLQKREESLIKLFWNHSQNK